jgi:hypothetical protein
MVRPFWVNTSFVSNVFLATCSGWPERFLRRQISVLQSKIQPILFTLILVNASVLLVSLTRPHPTAAREIAPVIRAHALEIVDDQGRVRAEIRVFPSNPNVKMPDGTTGYPETVLLRLVTSKGRPSVKIAATEDGSAVSFGGDSDPTNVQILARGATTSLKMVNKDGKQQLVKP